jgi:hypothetical protein
MQTRFLLLPCAAFLAASCSSPAEVGHASFKATPAPSFLSYPVQKPVTNPGDWGKVLTDIEGHLPASYGTQYQDSSKLTWGHETTHGINSDIRNYHNSTGQKANGFYVLEDRGVVIVEPPIKKSQVASFIPQSLRGMRFSLYITGQTAWDSEPLYIFDEWVAYANGAAVGVDLVQSGLYKEQWTDGVAGALEFTIYALGLALAVEQLAPQYFAQNTQFKEFLGWHALRAMGIFRAGKTMTPFTYADQDVLYQKLQTGADAAAMRGLLVKLYGQAFANQVLGLAPPPASDLGVKQDSKPPLAVDLGLAPPPGGEAGVAPPPPREAGSSPGAEGGVIEVNRPGARPGESMCAVAGPGSGPALLVLAVLALLRGQRRSRADRARY